MSRQDEGGQVDQRARQQGRRVRRNRRRATLLGVLAVVVVIVAVVVSAGGSSKSSTPTTTAAPAGGGHPTAAVKVATRPASLEAGVLSWQLPAAVSRPGRGAERQWIHRPRRTRPVTVVGGVGLFGGPGDRCGHTRRHLARRGPRCGGGPTGHVDLRTGWRVARHGGHHPVRSDPHRADRDRRPGHDHGRHRDREFADAPVRPGRCHHRFRSVRHGLCGRRLRRHHIPACRVGYHRRVPLHCCRPAVRSRPIRRRRRPGWAHLCIRRSDGDAGHRQLRRPMQSRSSIRPPTVHTWWPTSPRRSTVRRRSSSTAPSTSPGGRSRTVRP